MFLVPEDVLVGMLSSNGYANLKAVKGLYSKDFFESLDEKTQGKYGNNRNDIQAGSLMEFSKVAADLYKYVKSKEWAKI